MSWKIVLKIFDVSGTEPDLRAWHVERHLLKETLNGCSSRRSPKYCKFQLNSYEPASVLDQKRKKAFCGYHFGGARAISVIYKRNPVQMPDFKGRKLVQRLPLACF